MSTYLPYEVWWDSFPTEEQLGSQRGTKKSSQEVAEILEAANQPKKIAQTSQLRTEEAGKKVALVKAPKKIIMIYIMLNERTFIQGIRLIFYLIIWYPPFVHAMTQQEAD